MTSPGGARARVSLAIAWLTAPEPDARLKGISLAMELLDGRLVPHLFRMVVEHSVSLDANDRVSRHVSEGATRVLHALFDRHGFTAADRSDLLAAVHDSTAPDRGVLALLTGLRTWTVPLLKTLLDDPEPLTRARAVQASCVLLGPAQAVRHLDDPSAFVRAAAVACVQLDPGGTTRVKLEAMRSDPVAAVRSAVERRLDQADRSHLLNGDDQDGHDTVG